MVEREADVRLTFAESVVPGARIVAGTEASAHVSGEHLQYGTSATLTDVNLQTIGQAFDIAALDDPRYAGPFKAHVDGRGDGLSLPTLNLAMNGSISEAILPGGRLPEMSFEASVEQHVATIRASGTIADLDPSVMSGRNELHGRVAASFTVGARMPDVSAPLTFDSVDGALNVTLASSRVGGLEISGGRVEATYRHSIAEVARLELLGPGLDVSGMGTLAVGTSGSSDFTLRGEALDLETLGTLAELPISGLAQLDLQVAGNRSDLRADGTVIGSLLKYGDHGVVSLRSAISARVPDLSIERAAIDADTRAVFVTLAGQDINEVNAKTSYDAQRLDFELAAVQPDRSLQASGALMLHTDHPEVHLSKLDLTASQQTWTVPPGIEPTLHYAPDAIGIEHLRLTNGDQMVELDGRFGHLDESLHVSATNVELATIDALLLRPPQFSGRLNASAIVSGTRTAPTATAEVDVTNGGFKQFAYDSLHGVVTYRAPTVTIDARLQQNAAQWLTAKGSVPASLLTQASAGLNQDAPAHVEVDVSTDQIALTIDTSSIGLGVLNGFTTAVTDVAGTVEAHLTIAGAASDPHPSGAIVIANGALKVPATGVTYDHIAGQLDLQPDRLHINQITVLDNHQSALSITGDLAIHQRDVGGVRIWVNADDFHIIDNELGNLRMQSAVELGGELGAPQVRGYVGVTTGRINLDEILRRYGTSPYDTEAIDERESTPAGEKSSSPLDAMEMNVQLTVPDDLIVRAVDLQAPGSAVGLGRLNVTLGGDITARKRPAEPMSLVGDIQTIRGTYDFQGRRFDIVRGGAIRFDGLPELNPVLDLRMRREIQGVEARINVTGRLYEPTLTLSSTPPLEQADVLSLIVFNQPINQLGQGEQASLVARAQSLATGAVVGELAQSIGTALNLDTFEIAVDPDSGSTAEVTLGQQIGRNLFFKVVQGVGGSCQHQRDRRIRVSEVAALCSPTSCKAAISKPLSSAALRVPAPT